MMIEPDHKLGEKVWRVTKNGHIPVILRSITGLSATYFVNHNGEIRTGKLRDLFETMIEARLEFRRRRRAAKLAELGISEA